MTHHYTAQAHPQPRQLPDNSEHQQVGNEHLSQIIDQCIDIGTIQPCRVEFQPDASCVYDKKVKKCEKGQKEADRVSLASKENRRKRLEVLRKKRASLNGGVAMQMVDRAQNDKLDASKLERIRNRAAVQKSLNKKMLRDKSIQEENKWYAKKHPELKRGTEIVAQELENLPSNIAEEIRTQAQSLLNKIRDVTKRLELTAYDN